MVREFTCIMCPMGCELNAEAAEGCLDSGAVFRPEDITVSGNTCPRGREYAVQELTDPRRNIATSVLVEGGELPLASVRLSRAIPKEKIFDVMQEIRSRKLQAPVKAGQVVIADVLGLGSDVLVTKSVDKV